MRPEIEKRLHRVMISNSSSKEIRCRYASRCEKAQDCERCNIFFKKCSIFVKESFTISLNKMLE